MFKLFSVQNFNILNWSGDSARMYQLGFQDPATTTMEGIYLFNLHCAGYGYCTEFVPSRLMLALIWVAFGRIYKGVVGSILIMGGANYTRNWRKVAYRWRWKAILNCRVQNQQSLLVVFFRSFFEDLVLLLILGALRNLYGNIRLYYSTNTNGNSKSTAGDHRDTSLNSTNSDVKWWGQQN